MCKICQNNPCLARCPNADNPKTRGYCITCNEELREDYEYYTDNYGNEFCSDNCAIKYHGIKSEEWD